MKIYLDSSFLVSMYTVDANSIPAASVLAQTKGPLIISSLGEVEVANALELRVFRKELTRAEADRGHAAFEQDLSRGVLQVLEVASQTLLLTKDLILQHAAHVGCRTADIVHVATALQAKADRFFSFDFRQRALAKRVKLQTN